MLELAADDGAGVRVTVWDEDVPSVKYQARWDMPTGKLWTFRAWVYTTGNQLWLDTYQEERSVALATNVRVAGKHYEVDATSGQATKRYYAGGVLLATKTGTTLTYVQGDHLGSTSTLTGTDRKVVAKEKYSAFGERRRSMSTGDAPRRSVGSGNRRSRMPMPPIPSGS